MMDEEPEATKPEAGKPEGGECCDRGRAGSGWGPRNWEGEG